MVWWAWVLVGFLLLLGEILTPGGFFILFFGVGALVVGALGALGIELSPRRSVAAVHRRLDRLAGALPQAACSPAGPAARSRAARPT